MGIDHSNPYIHSTTVLCDKEVIGKLGCMYHLCSLCGPSTITGLDKWTELMDSTDGLDWWTH